MKKVIVSLIVLIIMVLTVVLLFRPQSKIKKKDNNKIQVITTVFPLYDFIKNVGGDKVEVSMLIPSGVDVHDYDPSPQDIISIEESDLFIYLGEDIEFWANTLTSGIDNQDKIVSVTDNIELIEREKFEEKYGLEEDEEEEEHEHEHNHSEKYDTHIWLDPTKSVEIVRNVEETLCKIDPDNSSYYRDNSEKYIKELELLDNDINKVVSESKKSKIAFGGPFAYAYFIERYNLDFISAYDSCGENGEPSVFKVKEVIEYMKENDIKVIFNKELSAGNIAKTIAMETDSEILEFNSVHTVTDEELKDEVSYISIMRKNLENLKRALK